jgi:hypothetical protein
MLQDYARRLGIIPSESEIKDLSAVLKELPRGHALDYLLRESPDFRKPGALADALLNPRDRAYTVPQLFDYLERCEMDFGRWFRQAPYLPQCGILSRLPHADRLANLPPKEQYAAVELFRGTISRHSFTAYRDDSFLEQHAIRFDGAAWKNYVPIRQPRLVCIQERLPPGTAAVLINQDHMDTDLTHFINALEKDLFDAIDNQRTIAEIIETVAVSTGRHPELKETQAFFERLWNYDHIVFDTSNNRI